RTGRHGAGASDAALGSGLIKAHPEARTGDEDGCEVVARRLFVSGCDFGEVFEFVEEPLDEVALAVDGRVDAALLLAVPLGGDVAAAASLLDHLDNGLRVVAAVRD